MPAVDLKTIDELRMWECLTLAEKGLGNVSPNPLVGALIVKDGTVVGKGYHRKFGGPHAEVFALRQAKHRARGSTLYVNLEPCCYYGKTPPCTDLIIASGVKRVIIGMKDPNPLVAGKGIRRLRAANIDVTVGVLERESRKLNEAFAKFITTGLPFVILKIAQTIDGNIADKRGRSRWITNEQSRRLVHALRARYDAVLVGANTVRLDNPLLTVREVKGRDPYRVIVDGKLTTSPKAAVYRRRNPERTILIIGREAGKRKKKLVTQFERLGVRVELLPATRGGNLSVRAILRVLAKNNIASVLVEGGARTFSEFLHANAVDKILFLIAPKILGPGVGAFSELSYRSLANVLTLSYIASWNLDGDILVEAYVKK